MHNEAVIVWERRSHGDKKRLGTTFNDAFPPQNGPSPRDLHDPTFNCFSRTPTCDKPSDGQTDTRQQHRLYRASIGLCFKNILTCVIHCITCTGDNEMHVRSELLVLSRHVVIAASRSETSSLVFVVLARWTLEKDQRAT